MGIVSTTLSQSNNMKFLLVLAVAAYARAEAEAKPGFVYTTGHLPLAYGYPYAVHHPLVYTAPVGCQNNQGVAVPCAHGVLPYGLVPAVAAPAAAEEDAAVSVEKREAEAEPTAEADAEADPEADPWLYYHGLGYAARPYGYGYYGLGHHYGYAGYGYGHHLGYAGYGYGHHLGYYGKRSAEAEPTAEADAEASPEADPWLYYHGLGYAARPYGYGYYGHHMGYSAYAGYHPYAYHGGCRNGYG